jgi:two-component system cell cycle sensor histidine kinase/response regulator CckA
MSDRGDKLRAILEESDEGFVEYRALPLEGGGFDFEFVDMNLAGARAFGVPREALLGRRVAELLRDDNGRAALGQFTRVYTTGEPMNYEMQAVEHGRTVWHRYRVVKTPEGVAVLTRRITDHKQVEKEREELQEQLRHAQRMESLGRLAGGIAHDFNNLLTPILAYSNMALDRLREGDPLYEELQEIRHAAERATALSRQILTFGRKQISQTMPESISAIVSGFSRMLRRLVGDDVELSFELADDLWYVLADRAQLEQVLANLIVNARDAIVGEGRITVRTRNVSLSADDLEVRSSGLPPGDWVLCEIEDTGAGIAPELLGRVFEPFFTTKDQIKGTGLGLSIVYGLVLQHGGHIRCDSEPGRGTVFRMYLPHTDEAPLAEDEADPPGGPGGPGAGTVLLVEDDQAVRRLAKVVLTERGYRVLEADSGAAALEVAALHVGPIDLLLTDVMMPRMDGRELFERLAARQPGLRAVFMSGYAEIEVDRGRFLAKPFAADALLAAVGEALSG